MPTPVVQQYRYLIDVEGIFFWNNSELYPIVTKAFNGVKFPTLDTSDSGTFAVDSTALAAALTSTVIDDIVSAAVSDATTKADGSTIYGYVGYVTVYTYDGVQQYNPLFTVAHQGSSSDVQDVLNSAVSEFLGTL